MSTILVLIGSILALVAGIWLLILAFKESFLWGLGCFIPIVGLIFAITHWDKASRPFLLQIGAGILVGIGRAFAEQ